MTRPGSRGRSGRGGLGSTAVTAQSDRVRGAHCEEQTSEPDSGMGIGGLGGRGLKNQGDKDGLGA